jgi:twinkle protein
MFVKTHQACLECGSSDAAGINEDGSSYCFSCAAHLPATAQAPVVLQERVTDFDSTRLLLQSRTARSIPERGLTSRTCEAYNCIISGENIIYGYYAPSEAHTPVAAKIRMPDKRFTSTGEWGKAGLYGQQLFTVGARYVTIC